MGIRGNDHDCGNCFADLMAGNAMTSYDKSIQMADSLMGMNRQKWAAFIKKKLDDYGQEAIKDYERKRWEESYREFEK